MRALLTIILITSIGCGKAAKDAPAADLSDCRFLTVQSHNFEHIGEANASVYQCVRGFKTCHVYIAVGGAAVSTDCEQY